MTHRDREDAKQLGAASAVLYHEGRDFKHAERVYGESITETDTRIRALSPGLKLLADFLATQNAQQQDGPGEAILAFPHATPLKKTLDASPHEEQATAIEHITQLGEILQNHPNLNIKLLSLPRNVPFVGFRRAKQLALEAIRTANLDELTDPQTIKSQRERIESDVISRWAERWYQDPHTSLAYRTALTKPPDGKPHPTFLRKNPQEKAELNNVPPQTAKSTYSRRTISTLYRMITGHLYRGIRTTLPSSTYTRTNRLPLR